MSKGSLGPARRGLLRRLARGLLALGLALLVVLVIQNSLLNLVVPVLLNNRPERLRIDYTLAWMVVPGHVHVRGLNIRSQGRADQWLISADSASGVIDVSELFDRHFYAYRLRASGLSVRYRRRLDAKGLAPEAERAPDSPTVRVEASMAPPIPGLSNPPDPVPEVLYPVRGVLWAITLYDIVAVDVREIWIGAYRATGDATVVADILLHGPYADVQGTMSITRARADIGDAPVAHAIVGKVSFLVAGMNRAQRGPDPYAAISAQARLGADVYDLRFLDFYLAEVPWLSFAGIGHVEIDAGLDEGEFRAASVLDASFPELVVRVASVDVTGAGRIHGEIGSYADGLPQSHIAVAFDDFAITPDGSTTALVEGLGFQLDLRSPDVSLYRPFSAVDVVMDLPESRVPDVTVYNAYLPKGVGMSLSRGLVTVHGRAQASSIGSRASGDVYLEGTDVVGRFDAMEITADVSAHALLADAKIDSGWYDLAGTSVRLDRVGLVDTAHPDELDGERGWSATLALASAEARVGSQVYFDATADLVSSDSVPFVRVFADQESLPRWLQGLMSVQDVAGEVRVQLGADRVEVGPCQVRGGGLQLDLRLLSEASATHGDLLAQAGPLSLGIGLRPGRPRFQVFGARNWFETGGDASDLPEDVR